MRKQKNNTKREREVNLIVVAVAVNEFADKPVLNLSKGVSLLFQLDLQQQTTSELAED